MKLYSCLAYVQNCVKVQIFLQTFLRDWRQSNLEHSTWGVVDEFFIFWFIRLNFDMYIIVQNCEEPSVCWFDDYSSSLWSKTFTSTHNRWMLYFIHCVCSQTVWKRLIARQKIDTKSGYCTVILQIHSSSMCTLQKDMVLFFAHFMWVTLTYHLITTSYKLHRI